MKNKPYAVGKDLDHKQSDAFAKERIVEILNDLLGSNLDRFNFNDSEANLDFSQGKFDLSFWMVGNSKQFRVEGEARPDLSNKHFSDPFDPDPIHLFPFCYSYLSIPYRKNDNRADLYSLISTRHPLAWLCPMSIIHQSPVIEKTALNFGDKELWFDVPLSARYFYQKKNGRWQKWEKK
jgi:hypothetical protein